MVGRQIHTPTYAKSSYVLNRMRSVSGQNEEKPIFLMREG